MEVVEAQGIWPRQLEVDFADSKVASKDGQHFINDAEHILF